MNCPKCGGNTKVTDSRSDSKSVHRRRKCILCGNVFYTAETKSDSDDMFKKTYNNYHNRRRNYES